MNKSLKALFTLIAAALLSSAMAQVEITYWQYDFAARIEAMDQLIEKFNAENPDIVVKQEIPAAYDGYEPAVAAAATAGTGPDIVQLFYGWVGPWERAGYIEPVPQEHFDHEWIQEFFIPSIEAVKINGEYYGLPTSVRALALFYNKDHFREAGLDPDNPPATWDEFIEAGKALTVKSGSRFERAGFGIALTGQDHHLVRTILMNQLGTPPYSADNTEVLYGNEIGAQAIDFYTSLQLEHEIGLNELNPGTNGYRDGFRGFENISMIIDGSFALADVRKVDFDWGVAEIPTFDNGVQSNFGSYWMNGFTSRAYESPEKLEAASRFMKFITSEEAQLLWLDIVGELPAGRATLDNPELEADPELGAFIRGLRYAEATQFVDEAGQRDVLVDAINGVLLGGLTPEQAAKQAAAGDQELLDEFNK